MPSSRLFSLQTICYTCTVGVRTETQDCAGLCRSFHELRTREKKDKNISLRILYDLTGTDRHTGYNTRGKVIIIPVYSGSSHRGKNFAYRKLTAETGMIITGGRTGGEITIVRITTTLDYSRNRFWPCSMGRRRFECSEVRIYTPERENCSERILARLREKL